MTGGAFPRRYEGIELLRFVLALGVCVYHYYYYGPHAELIPFRPIDGMGLGYLMFGVETFFAVSGFVIILSTANRTPVEFMLARMARLGPTLLVASSITLLVYHLLDVEPRIPHAGFRYLFSISFFPLMRLGGGLDWSLWSLSFEIRFYALVFLCMFLVDVRRRALQLAIVMLAYDAARLAFPYLTGHPIPSRVDVMRDYASFFALGVLIYHRVTTGKNGPVWAAAVTVAFLLCCVRATQLFEQLNHDTLKVRAAHLSDGVLVTISIFVLMVASVRRIRSPSLARAFGIAGRASYPLYVVHQLCGYWTINFLTRHLGLHFDLRPVLITIVVALSIAFGNALEPQLISIYKRVLTDAWGILAGIRSRARARLRPPLADISPAREAWVQDAAPAMIPAPRSISSHHSAD